MVCAINNIMMRTSPYQKSGKNLDGIKIDEEY